MLRRESRRIDLVTAVGRLLSSIELRDAFEQSPLAVADRLGIAESDRAVFLSLDAQQLNQQAETLIQKRWHEVRRLAPRTIEALGDSAGELFQFYAGRFWPQGHRRHQLDAFRFLQFLAANDIDCIDKKELRRLARHA